MKISWFCFFLFGIILFMKGKGISTLKTNATMPSTTTNIEPDTKTADDLQEINTEQQGNILTAIKQTDIQVLLNRIFNVSSSNTIKFLLNCASNSDNCGSLDDAIGFMCEETEVSLFHNETYIGSTQNESPVEDFRLSYFFGFVALLCNVVTIILIAANPSLRKPFYLSILSLAIADIICIFYEFKNIFNPKEPCSFKSFQKVFDVYKYATKLNGKLNITLVATVRYCMFVYPLKSRAFLRNLYIGISSVLCFILSGIYGYCIVNYIWWLKKFQTRTLIIVTDDVILIVFFIIINISFFIHRLNTVKTSKAAGDLKVKMTFIVVFILILNTFDSIVSLVQSLLEAPFFNSHILEGSFANENSSGLPAVNLSILKNSPFDDLPNIPVGNYDLDKNWSDFFHFGGPYYNILVHGINPFLYFFSSPGVIRIFTSVRKCFWKK